MPDEEAKKERKPSHPPPELAKKIPVTRLFPFPDHPFSVTDDDSMRELIDSVKANGVLTPAIVRPREEGGYCDDCGYLLTKFSVTVPASLSIAMAETGKITTATNAAILNNSTAAVKVSGVTVTAENGWTIVPFNYNMAAAKVDSKLIGFSINNVKTAKNGKTDALSIGNGWSIAKGASLPLSYDAVISATSTAITKQNVLTLVFVVNWA